MFTETLTQHVDSVRQEIELIKRELITRGIHLRVGRDFDVFCQHIQRSSQRATVHSQFDPKGNMDGAKDAFWICGFDADGELVQTQAAHLLDLRKSTISNHIKLHVANYFPKVPDLIHSSIKAKLGPKASKIQGMIAYHGEMWLAPGYRDKGTAALVTRLGILLVVQEWNPDAMFGLMNWSLACSGFNMRIGYLHSEPMTLGWERRSNGAEHQVWLVYLEREDISFLRDLPIVEFASLLESDFA